MYSTLVGIDGEKSPSAQGLWGGKRVFGRVAKIPGDTAKTFSHRNLTESIDTFCVSMIKYNETKCTNKGDADMLSKMNAKLENQFAAFFAVGSVFPFLRDSNFSI